MAVNSPITDEGEQTILRCWYDVLEERDMKAYAVITPFTKPLNQYTYADKATVTHSAVVSADPPDDYEWNTPSLPASDGYASINFINWSITNSSGTNKTVYGYLVIDETTESCILAVQAFTPFTLANGASVAFDYYFWLNGTADPNP